MKRRLLFVLVLLMLIAATVVASLGSRRGEVSLASLRQLWSDTIRDIDQPGLRLTRLSAAEEMQLGANVLNSVSWPEDPVAAARVERIAQPMLPHVHRTDIQYHFHVVQAGMINAFALPGGQVLVTDGMLAFVQSDDELAEVVGHEMSHVDLRHCVEHYQYQYRLGSLVELFHRLAAMPYSSDQELDADAEGMRLAIAGGYNPAAGPVLFERMQKEMHESAGSPATTPAGELAHSLGEALASYFRSHPPSAERARRLRGLARSAHGAGG
ncbi:MAG TPA: M48 family metallopeptidase [Bryobacteraceae bacterium]|nr:M48 family metallopeptidase [Bryobacteraceae bacterium]